MLMPRKAPEKTFWITNISDRNVSLGDLAISIPAMASVNLLDKKHYGLTEEQVKKSAANGSIAKKGDKIVVRAVPPVVSGQRPMPFCQDPVPSRGASIYEMKQEHYEELQISDDTLDVDPDKIQVSNNTPIEPKK
jgi:hypothetical protein